MWTAGQLAVHVWTLFTRTMFRSGFFSTISKEPLTPAAPATSFSTTLSSSSQVTMARKTGPRQLPAPSAATRDPPMKAATAFPSLPPGQPGGWGTGGPKPPEKPLPDCLLSTTFLPRLRKSLARPFQTCPKERLARRTAPRNWQLCAGKPALRDLRYSRMTTERRPERTQSSGR